MRILVVEDELKMASLLQRGLVEEAHEEAKRTLADIRDLDRGIHPAVLSDRGLDAAISALADRCPVPVAVDAEGWTAELAATEFTLASGESASTTLLVTSPIDAKAPWAAYRAALMVRPFAEAGATWWIESPWLPPNEPEDLRRRIEAGPPRVELS